MYHWYVKGAVPLAATLSDALCPDATVWLCGGVVTAGATTAGGAGVDGGGGGAATVIVALAESAEPAAFDTRTQ